MNSSLSDTGLQSALSTQEHWTPQIRRPTYKQDDTNARAL